MPLSSSITAIQQINPKESSSMKRSILASALALGIALTALGPITTTSAASAPAGSHRAANTLVRLARTIDGFGYAVINGPDRAINGYATAALLRRAPGGHLVNLIGPMQNPPSGYHYRISAYNSANAAVIMTWTWGQSTGLNDRLILLNTSAGWKVNTIQVLGRFVDRHAGLIAANNLFAQRLKYSSSFALNDFASRGLLDRAPNHMVAAYFPMQNPPRSVSYHIDRFTSSTANVTMTLDWGSAVRQYKLLTWAFTASGWQLASVANANSGRS